MSSPVAGGSGLLGCHGDKNFPRSPPGKMSHFLFSRAAQSSRSTSAQPRPASGWLGLCSELQPLRVGSAWPWAMRLLGPHAYGGAQVRARKQERSKRNKREGIPLSADYAFPSFSRACIGVHRPSQWPCSQVRLTGHLPCVTLSSLCRLLSPLCPLLDPFPSDLRAMVVPWRGCSCSFLVKPPRWPCSQCLAFGCFLLTININN